MKNIYVVIFWAVCSFLCFIGFLKSINTNLGWAAFYGFCCLVGAKMAKEAQ